MALIANGPMADEPTLIFNPVIQGCQFSDFSLISDFLTIEETGIKLIKYGKNMDKILKVFNPLLPSNVYRRHCPPPPLFPAMSIGVSRFCLISLTLGNS